MRVTLIFLFKITKKIFLFFKWPRNEIPKKNFKSVCFWKKSLPFSQISIFSILVFSWSVNLTQCGPVNVILEYSPSVLDFATRMVVDENHGSLTVRLTYQPTVQFDWKQCSFSWKYFPCEYLSRSPHLWANTRMYLVNMAVSDIIMCITAVPVTPYVAFTGHWVFGQYFCHFLPLCQVRQ